MHMRWFRQITIVTLALLSVSTPACNDEVVLEPYLPKNAHEAYAHSIERARLMETALGRDWIAAADVAITRATRVLPPFQEVLYIDPSRVFSAGYRFKALRGYQIEAQVELVSHESMQLFVDLFRATEDSVRSPVHIASAGEHDKRLVFEPRLDGDYVLRVQSELLRGGQCKVTIRSVSTLDFPVSGHSIRSIGSVFGAPRDAGRRRHHGVDIFARRHTPVIAPTNALVRQVTVSGIGGRVIWLQDSKRSLDLYFAHLQTQRVEEGTWVQKGEVIGTVGNSGNARTTYPHLHFGIYDRDTNPIDPYHFIVPPNQRLREARIDPDSLGSWARTIATDISLRPMPDFRSAPIGTVEIHTPMRIMGGTHRHYKVALPDGETGYITAGGLERADRPIGSNPIAVDRDVLDYPGYRAAAIERVSAGNRIPILGNYRDFHLVRTASGRTGWLPAH